MLKRILFLFLGVISGYEKYSLIHIPEITQDNIFLLSQSGFDLDHGFNYNDNRFELVMSRTEIQLLQDLEINYSIKYEDLEAFYSSRLNTDISRDFENGSMGGYYTFIEVEENLDELISECPNIISQKTSIGQSLEGREIWMVRVSDNPNTEEDEPEALFTGLHHAREPMSYMNLFYYMNYLCENYDSDIEIRNIVNNRELYFIPVVNPDGLVYNESIAPDGGGLQRKNSLESCVNNNDDDLWDGVDLNRNYGYYWGFDDDGSSPDGCSQTYRGTAPFSEPETDAIKNLVEEHNFKIALNYHSYGNILIYPFGWDYNQVPPESDFEIFTEFGTEMTQFNSYNIGTGPELLYTVNGEANDWMYGEKGIFAFTPEIGSFIDGFWPSTDRIIPLAEQNLFPNKFISIASGPMYASNSIISNGPYNQGSSYTVDIHVKNRGLSNSAGDLILSIETSGGLVVDVNEFNLNTLESRQEIFLDQLFSFTVSENVMAGTFANLLIILQDDEGIEYTQNFELLIGSPLTIINQEFEEEDEINWYNGQFNDDATSGIWEWGIPNGTEINGITIQPFYDHSENGSSCFITGNSIGQSNAAYDDVDGGTTILYSPSYNLSDYAVAYVNYWRWYNNDMGDNPGTDRWIVEVTNNGGGSWTALDDFHISVLEESPVIFGDVNYDQLVNIIDVITIVNYIIGNSIPSSNQEYIADYNQSGEINILDIVEIVNLILGIE